VTILRVATLNLSFHPHNRWQERQPLIAQGLEAVRLDLVALQEVDRQGDGDHAVAGSRLANTHSHPRSTRATIWRSSSTSR
jgi:endonuclease/exonuclease/phosphatase family metal-dependent hydrolase